MPDDFTLLHPAHDPDLVHRGLRVLVGGPEQAPGIPERGNLDDINLRLDGFLAYAQSIRLDPSRQVLALRTCPNGEQLIAGMCLWVPAPGKTAMLFGPALSDFPHAAPATQLAVQAALTHAKNAGILLVQAMMEPNDAAGKTTFAAAGLWQLATLTYMERRPPVSAPAFTFPADLALLPYEAKTHPLFRDAILRSYDGTLDCPALSGLRDIEDVIDGHQAVGPFDPQLWTVLVRNTNATPVVPTPPSAGQVVPTPSSARQVVPTPSSAGQVAPAPNPSRDRQGATPSQHSASQLPITNDQLPPTSQLPITNSQLPPASQLPITNPQLPITNYQLPPTPLGCLLLAEIPARRALELVYLGLTPEARGMGLGRLLMQRLLAIAARRHFDLLTLAVDANNSPATRLYRRCGYTSVAQRIALVRKLT